MFDLKRDMLYDFYLEGYEKITIENIVDKYRDDFDCTEDELYDMVVDTYGEDIEEVYEEFRNDKIEDAKAMQEELYERW